MLAELLPADVIAVETVGDDDPDAYLLPAEQPLVAKAVAKRTREVTNARSCARRALAELGRPALPILRGGKGEPLWPAGVVGSITHTTGYYAAAVADADKVRSIGVDAEEHGALPDGVLDHIAFGPELTRLAELRARDGEIWWDRLLFSAKESVYKAWFPLAQRWLGFEDAALLFTPGPDPTRGTFTADLLVDDLPVVGGRSLRTLHGRYAAIGGLLGTAIAANAPGR